MVTTDEIVKYMNAMVEGSIAENVETVEQALGEQVIEQTSDLVGEPSGEPSADPAPEESKEGPIEAPVYGESNEAPLRDSDDQEGVPELEPAAEEESDDKAEDSDSEEEEEIESEGTLRRSERIKTGVRKPTRYVAHTKLKAGLQNMQETNVMIKRAE
jgi:hypothetical protein